MSWSQIFRDGLSFSLFQSKIIQILDPQFVADQVVDATLSNKAIIMLPWWTSYLIMLKVPFLLVLVHSFNINVDLVFFLQHLVPSPAMMKLSTAFGSNCSIDQVIIVTIIAITIVITTIIAIANIINMEQFKLNIKWSPFQVQVHHDFFLSVHWEGF